MARSIVVTPDSFYGATLVSNMDHLRLAALRQTLRALRPIALQVWLIVFGEPPEIDAGPAAPPLGPPPPKAPPDAAWRAEGKARAYQEWPSPKSPAAGIRLIPVPEAEADPQLLPIELLPSPPPPPAAAGLPARRRRGRAPPWIRIARGIVRLDFIRRVWGLLGQHLRSSRQRGRQIALRV